MLPYQFTSFLFRSLLTDRNFFCVLCYGCTLISCITNSTVLWGVTEYVLYLWPFLLLVDYLYICILSFDHEIARTDRVCGCELCILGIFLYLLFVSVVGSGVCVPQTHSLPSQLLNSVVITSCCFDLTVGCS